MKKRVKLFTTIASLCLAVALMAFGVYAATQITVSVTNKVTYSATANVKAAIWYTTYKDNNTTDYDATKKPRTTDKSAADPDITYIGNETPAETTGAIKIGEGENGEVELKAVHGNAENMIYSYTIHIKNTIPATDSYPYLKVVVTPMNTTSEQYATAAAFFEANRYKVETTYGSVATGATTVLNTNEEMTYTVTLTVDNAHSLPQAGVELATSFVLTAQAEA